MYEVSFSVLSWLPLFADLHIVFLLVLLHLWTIEANWAWDKIYMNAGKGKDVNLLYFLISSCLWRVGSYEKQHGAKRRTSEVKMWSEKEGLKKMWSEQIEGRIKRDKT